MSCSCSHRPTFFLLLVSWLLSLPPHAESHFTITHLPGFDGPLPFHLETGYVSVGEMEGARMFYYFIESERNPREDPIVLWLTGGPGCSGLSGLLFEIGPLTIHTSLYDGNLPTLVRREYSWTKVFSVIFLDSPVGTGFSYSTGHEGFQMGDNTTAKLIYDFMEKWFASHQEFLTNYLYIGGDSYSGIVVPLVAQIIANGNSFGDATFMNLKGYLVGNPKSDAEFDHNSQIPYVHRMGLLSDELYESTKQSCNGVYSTPRDALCAEYIEEVNECISGICSAHILEPKCPSESPKLQATASRRVLQDIPLYCRSYGYLLSIYWANNDTVREVLGVNKGSIDSWKRCNKQLNYTKDFPSVVAVHHHLTTSGYRALIYSGDHDMVVNCLGTEGWIKSLNFSIVDDWRPWWVDGQVAGFTRTYSNNLTFATVKGGGHTAPEYKPKECLEMLQRWIHDESL